MGRMSEVHADAVPTGTAACIVEWSYDMTRIPDRPVEVAFDNCLGFCNVRICQQRRQWDGVRDEGMLVVGYYQEDSNVDLSAGTGWRPYAWRDIPVPPPTAP